MKPKLFSLLKYSSFMLLSILTATCSNTGNKNNSGTDSSPVEGSYAYDKAFFAQQDIETVELKDPSSGSRVLIVPGYQGRVMTSAAGGDSGKSFGWINYKQIRSDTVSKQFNPYGGEERLWLGPEGGPFSIYFNKGDEQVFSNWKVPEVLDTEPFDMVNHSSSKAVFKKRFTLTNAAGTKLNIGIERTVKLLTPQDIERDLHLKPGNSIKSVAFESENNLTNEGDESWNENSGFLSIWMLCMFNPSEQGVVFIPFRKEKNSGSEKFLTDDYFGKVPANRLKIKDSIIYFKIDGKYRSKIGISPAAALSWCGSYDAGSQVLTLLWHSEPEQPSRYVNSKWGHQDKPLKGDVVNSYNDGPTEDGSVMGPFYEIESSSPAALLEPGQKITHTERIFHLLGDEEQLSRITEKIFGVPIATIKQVF